MGGGRSPGFADAIGPTEGGSQQQQQQLLGEKQLAGGAGH